MKVRPRALVVDDNAINRLVLEAQLEALGLDAVTAASGQQALGQLAEQHFDVVLMDCEMPTLDGYETTRGLRQREKGGGQRTVVIGVTSFAREDAQSRALAAGMDDYRVKPATAEQLAKALEPWLPRPQDSALTAKTSANMAEPFATVRRLESAVDKELLMQAATTFRQEGEQELATMHRALLDSDAETLARCAHAFGGCCDLLSASVVARYCDELEVAARTGDLAACKAQLQRMEAEFRRFVGLLDEATHE